MAMLAVLAISGTVHAAEYATENFVIKNAPTPELAQLFGETAERCRLEMAELWLGTHLPPWSAPCPIRVKVGPFGAGGQTTFIPHNGEVYGWEMDIQGTAERIVDSVLPHEITHMVLASHFREPLPRWLDEGAATSVEHVSEQSNYRRMLLNFLDPGEAKALPFNKMVALREYPADPMPLYAQGHAVVEFLLLQDGHRHFIRFVECGMRTKNWTAAVRESYGYANLGEFQIAWSRWMRDGFPKTDLTAYRSASRRENGVVTTPVAPPQPMVAEALPAYAAKTVLPGPAEDERIVLRAPAGQPVSESSILLEWSRPVYR